MKISKRCQEGYTGLINISMQEGFLKLYSDLLVSCLVGFVLKKGPEIISIVYIHCKICLCISKNMQKVTLPTSFYTRVRHT